MKRNGSEDGTSQKDFREDERRESDGLLPCDVARRVCDPNTTGTEGPQGQRVQAAKAQREIIFQRHLLSNIAFPSRFDAKGTEHAVRFRGQYVEKHQHSDGWVPFVDPAGKLAIRGALPVEYLRRLEYQNELFGDHIRVIGLTRANRFVISQPTLRGGEPSEIEIRDVLLDGGWQRVPMSAQSLPSQLMGSAWWHNEEGLVLVDARKPNFKKTEFGVLPIDLILADLSPEMRILFTET